MKFKIKTFNKLTSKGYKKNNIQQQNAFTNKHQHKKQTYVHEKQFI